MISYTLNHKINLRSLKRLEQISDRYENIYLGFDRIGNRLNFLYVIPPLLIIFFNVQIWVSLIAIGLIGIGIFLYLKLILIRHLDRWRYFVHRSKKRFDRRASQIEIQAGIL